MLCENSHSERNCFSLAIFAEARVQEGYKLDPRFHEDNKGNEYEYDRGAKGTKESRILHCLEVVIFLTPKYKNEMASPTGFEPVLLP